MGENFRHRSERRQVGVDPEALVAEKDVRQRPARADQDGGILSSASSTVRVVRRVVGRGFRWRHPAGGWRGNGEGATQWIHTRQVRGTSYCVQGIVSTAAWRRLTMETFWNWKRHSALRAPWPYPRPVRWRLLGISPRSGADFLASPRTTCPFITYKYGVPAKLGSRSSSRIQTQIPGSPSVTWPALLPPINATLVSSRELRRRPQSQVPDRGALPTRTYSSNYPILLREQ